MEEKRVCENCFGDEYLKEYIREKGELNKLCSFCPKTKTYSISLDSISTHIEKCILIAHDRAEECLNNNHTNKLIAPLQKIGRLASLSNIEAIYFIQANAECSRDLATLIAKKKHLKYLTLQKHRGFIASLLLKDDYYLYRQFEAETKYNNRFFINDESLKFLNKIIKILQEKAIVQIPIGTIFFRSRLGKLNKATDLYSPRNVKKQNRMTPAGISALYLASNMNTSLLEIFIGNIEEEITTSTIETLKPLTIVDLTLLNKSPESCFHPEYSLYKFLDYFMRQISKPIKNEDASYEYVPTQIITEYIKTKIPEINGIAYPSNRSTSGKNYVLFFDQHNYITDKEKMGPNTYLIFNTPKTYQLKYSLNIDHIFDLSD